MLDPLHTRSGTLVLPYVAAVTPRRRPAPTASPSGPVVSSCTPATIPAPSPATTRSEVTHVTPLERLQLAAALGHAVPASELRLHTPAGETIFVSAHPSADIDPCAMRRVVLAFACPNNTDHSGRVAAVEFGGSLTDLGGGLFGVGRNGMEQRWVASLLTPDRIAELLDDVGLDELPDDALHACLKPDPELGVTLLVITANDERYRHLLDDIATQAAAAIFVEELRCTATHDARRSQPHFESVRESSGEAS